MATDHSTNVPSLIDLTGRRFGSWQVIGIDPMRKYTATCRVSFWLCRCDCGKERTVKGQNLRNGTSTSCGCRFRGIDHVGKRFGRLTVIERSSRVGKKVFWVCRCDCGAVKDIEAYKLRKGESTSCGCFHRERSSAANRKHGQSNTVQYHSWAGMVSRCTNPKSPAWENYGGRGIRVCKRWLASAANFLEDMGPIPDDDHSIDRIDNNGNYTCGKCEECRERGQPANCRWATRFQQSCNRRTNRRLTHDGKSLTVREWCLLLGLKRNTIEGRLRSGWSVERILTTPQPPRRKSPTLPRP